MAATKVIIVYSPNQNAVRRVIHPDHDAQIDALLSTVQAGEEYLIEDIEDYKVYGPYALLGWNKLTPPDSTRCVVVRDELVVATVNADPSIDVIPDAELHQHDEACVGWNCCNGSFTANGEDPSE